MAPAAAVPDAEATDIPTLTNGVVYASPDGKQKLRIKAVDEMGIITVEPAVDGSIYVPLSHFAGWKRVKEDWSAQRQWALDNGWVWKGP